MRPPDPNSGQRPKWTLFDAEERRKTLKKAAEIREEFRKKK